MRLIYSLAVFLSLAVSFFNAANVHMLKTLPNEESAKFNSGSTELISSLFPIAEGILAFAHDSLESQDSKVSWRTVYYKPQVALEKRLLAQPKKK